MAQEKGDQMSAVASDPPIEGRAAVRRWVKLLDRAEVALREADPNDPCAHRNAHRLLDSLLLYEHQLTPQTRRQAREYVWRRDHPDEPLPTQPAHLPGEGPPERLCYCPLCRTTWEACGCRSCRLRRLRGTHALSPSGPASVEALPAPGTPAPGDAATAFEQLSLFAGGTPEDSGQRA
jgi:hypothetical protein